jgi:D-serine deaminase-like pyridoxal phosphate-dependent protein
MLDVSVEIEVGQTRCGVASEASGALARQVVLHGSRFAGLQAHHGGAQHLRSPESRQAAIWQVGMLVRAAHASIARAGIQCPLVSGAGTGTFEFEAASGRWDELLCGSYLLLDADYADNEYTQRVSGINHLQFEHTRSS